MIAGLGDECASVTTQRGMMFVDQKELVMTDTTPTLRICNEDGTHHFTDLKKLSLSGCHYLDSVNTEHEPTRAMLIGTAVHHLVLGPRPTGKPVVLFKGARRSGKEWDAFRIEHQAAEIITAPEWEEAEAIATAVKEDPLAQSMLAGARLETPLRWEEDGLLFSTSGVDIITATGGLGDLKTTTSTQPDAFMRQALKMFYHAQVAFYLRGARACGLKVSGSLFILGVETKSPYAVVELELTEEMISLGDRTVSLWIETLKTLRASIPTPKRAKDWPAYAQSAVTWDVPAWLNKPDEGDDDDLEEVAAA